MPAAGAVNRRLIPVIRQRLLQCSKHDLGQSSQKVFDFAHFDGDSPVVPVAQIVLTGEGQLGAGSDGVNHHFKQRCCGVAVDPGIVVLDEVSAIALSL
ncbi:hypothetical protein D3C76_1579600 [compost metagenome]